MFSRPPYVRSLLLADKHAKRNFLVNSEPTCLPRICISLAGPLPGWMYQVCSIIGSASHSTVCTLCLLPFANLTSEGGPVPEYWSLFVSVQLSGWPVNLFCFVLFFFFFFSAALLRAVPVFLLIETCHSSHSFTPWKVHILSMLVQSICYSQGPLGTWWDLQARKQRSWWSTSICSCFQIAWLFQLFSNAKSSAKQKHLFPVLFCISKTEVVGSTEFP